MNERNNENNTPVKQKDHMHPKPDDSRDELERKELYWKSAAHARPWHLKPNNWLAVGTAIAAILGVFGQSILSNIKSARLEAQLDRQKVVLESRDKSIGERDRRIAEQQTRIDAMEEKRLIVANDLAHFTRMLADLGSEMDENYYNAIFPEEAVVVYEHEENRDTDSYYGVQLRRTAGGLYFLWEIGGYDSPTGSASIGKWLSTEAAIRWASANMSLSEMLAAFSPKELALFLPVIDNGDSG